MNLPHLLNDYHDAQLERVAIGPRRELTLFLHLDPVWNPSILEYAVVRFGSIDNFDEVERFFSALRCDPASDFITGVSRLEPVQRGRWVLDLDGYEEIVIQTTRCTEQKR
jgi:hypothetical protein